MSVNWSCSECPAYIEADKHDEDSVEWKNFASLREALIWGLVLVGFPPKSDWMITEDNWQEVFKRLFIAEKIYGAYRQHIEGGEIVSVYFVGIEVKSMIGLRVNAGNKTKAQFDKLMMKHMYERATSKLNVESREEDFEVTAA